MKIKRPYTISIGLTLIAMLLLSSCDPQARQSSAGGEQTLAPAPAITADALDAGGSNAVQMDYGMDGGGERELWYGDWILVDYTFAPVSAWGAENAQAMLGQRISYGKESAMVQGETYPDPYYSEEPVLAEDFSSSFRGRLTFGDIWLDGESTGFVAVNNASFFGDRFYVRDVDSLVIEKDGAFFLAQRAGRTLNEESVLPEGCFDVWFNGWGDVRFVSTLPVEHEDVVFLLTQEGQIVYTFPAADSSDQGMGIVDSVEAVSFQDVDHDGQTDVVAIVNYVAGADPQGMVPRPALRIYLQDGRRFVLASDLMAQATEYGNVAEGGSMTMDVVRAFFGLNGV